MIDSVTGSATSKYIKENRRCQEVQGSLLWGRESTACVSPAPEMPALQPSNRIGAWQKSKYKL